MFFTLLTLLVLLEIKHFLFDFVFQSPYQLENKGVYGHPGGLLHAGLHAGATAVILAVFAFQPALLLAVVAGEFVVHYHLDWGKEKIRQLAARPDDAFTWRMVGLDQLLHHLTYIAIAAVLSLTVSGEFQGLL
jgi:hypothetical protein